MVLHAAELDGCQQELAKTAHGQWLLPLCYHDVRLGQAQADEDSVVGLVIAAG
jgi:hypothetical protein